MNKRFGEKLTEYVEDGFNDWYLPAYTEILLLFSNSFTVNKALSQLPGALEFKEHQPFVIYATSNEYDSQSSKCFTFCNDVFSAATKNDVGMQYWIRPIRSF
jgi:hypothetical protein